MARLGLAFFCLWAVVCVHGAPGYGQRDNNHGGDSSSKDAENDRITSIALPISHINNEDGGTHTGHGAGAGAKETSHENAKNGDHSSVRENEGSGKKETGSRGDANDNSSNGNHGDGVKEAQSGAGKENVNHDSSSSYGSVSGGKNTGDNNHGGNGKLDNKRNVRDTSGISSGPDGGHVGISGVKGDGPSSEGQGDTEGPGTKSGADINKSIGALIG